MEQENDVIEQMERHLQSSSLAWLLGAGISFGAGIPLMGPLTDRVLAILEEDEDEKSKAHIAMLKQWLKDTLPEGAHIEHLLNHLGDYAALAERSRDGLVRVGETDLKERDLHAIHQLLATAIANTIRFGYCEASELVV